MPRSKKKNLEAREQFFRLYSAEILMRYNALMYDAFIKIEIDGVECDYYPGAPQKNALNRGKLGRLNRIVGGSNNWSDLDHQDFLNHLKIDVPSI